MRLVAYLLPAVLLACGTGGQTAGDAGTADSAINVVDRATAEAALIQSYADNWVRCGYCDPAYCRQRGREYLSFYSAQVADDDALAQAMLDSGEYKFDLDRAIRCVDEVRASEACFDPNYPTTPASCSDWYVPLRLEGASCHQACAEGLHCDASAQTCPGSCKSGGTAGFATEGGSCAFATCASGLFCNFDSICVKSIAVGGACPEGFGCLFGLECRAGLCSRLPGQGEVCSGRCKLGLDCVACGAGETCTGGTGLCKVRKQGDSCHVGGCDWALSCSPASATCVPFADLGQKCEPRSSRTSTCKVPFHCDEATTTCVERKPVGGTCVEDFDCEDPLRCTSGTCTAPWCLFPP